jgi:hypothetical protein
MLSDLAGRYTAAEMKHVADALDEAAGGMTQENGMTQEKESRNG